MAFEGLIGPDKRGYQVNSFHSSPQKHIVGFQKKLIEERLMSTHKRNKKNISTFALKKSILSRVMVQLFQLKYFFLFLCRNIC